MAVSSAVATHAAMGATRNIPIVTALAADSIGDGLVASVAHPGGNVTGVELILPDLIVKRLELLKEAVPKCLASRCYGIRVRLGT
jgi:putative tryptophan/tyrosine transport system substrate-binding protein